jgi:hypothetical protein
MHSVSAACAFVGQVGNLRRIVNPPASSSYNLPYVGQAILPAAAFQAALLRGRKAVPQYWLRHSEARRLKAGGSQDWLPHTGAKVL